MRVVLVKPPQVRPHKVKSHLGCHQCQRVISALKTRGMNVQIEDRAECLSGLDFHEFDAILVFGENDIPATLISSIRRLAQQKIVVVFGDLNHAARLAVLEDGADVCLTGEISGKEIHQHLINLMKMTVPSRGQDTYLEVADLRVGLMHLDVYRGSTKIRLNKREYQLLRYLTLNAQRVISRNELIEHVWGINDKANENTLDVYMHRLRCKIDQFEGCHRLIHTMRGVGYYLGESKH